MSPCGPIRFMVSIYTCPLYALLGPPKMLRYSVNICSLSAAYAAFVRLQLPQRPWGNGFTVIAPRTPSYLSVNGPGDRFNHHGGAAAFPGHRSPPPASHLTGRPLSPAAGPSYPVPLFRLLEWNPEMGLRYPPGRYAPHGDFFQKFIPGKIDPPGFDSPQKFYKQKSGRGIWPSGSDSGASLGNPDLSPAQPQSSLLGPQRGR